MSWFNFYWFISTFSLNSHYIELILSKPLLLSSFNYLDYLSPSNCFSYSEVISFFKPVLFFFDLTDDFPPFSWFRSMELLLPKIKSAYLSVRIHYWSRIRSDPVNKLETFVYILCYSMLQLGPLTNENLTVSTSIF